MARLNDPPAPAPESVDALKRRFIRQNREIARINSNQSQRIRNLENEISRLLAENIALREQGIKATTEAEKWKRASLDRDVVELKSRLVSKLAEVNVLIEELGVLPAKAARRSNVLRRRTGLTQHSPRSPESRDWRTRQNVDAMASGERDEQDGKLPPILEDKYYPRRTLETDELRILTAVAAADIEAEDTESPDLGPPPVAHFEVAEPIAFDSAKSPKRVSGGMIVNDEEVLVLPKDTENRRKRRTSSLLQDMTGLQSDSNDSSKEMDGKSLLSLKSSSKRKFDISEMDLDMSQTSQNDDFEFSRKGATTTIRNRPSRFTAKPANDEQAEKQAPSPRKTLQPRSILGPKSTNSPAKKVITGKLEKTEATEHLRGITNSMKATTRRTALPPKSLLVLSAEPLQLDEEGNDAKCPPKTPAPSLEDAVLTPTSELEVATSHKSTEAAITNSVEDVLNGSIGRGSRRARPAVSYAEPNLRDKMRRPDKKLVGAVEGLNKQTGTTDRDMSRDKSIEPTQTASTNSVVKVKSEKPSSEENWKEIPEANTEDEAVSPLKDKERHNSLGQAGIRHRKALSESATTRSRIPAIDDDNLDHAISRLSIYEPPDSSPVSSSTITAESVTATAGHQRTKSDSTSSINRRLDRPSSNTITAAASTSVTRSRRHSAQPSSNSIILPGTAESKTQRGPSIPAPYIPGAGKENISLSSTSKLKRATSVQVMTQHAGIGPQTAGLSQGDAAHVKTATMPPERTLGPRRRSMMV